MNNFLILGLIYYIISSLISLIVSIYINDKYYIKIRLPKQKKIKAKNNEIYQLVVRDNYFDNEDIYVIKKWKLDWCKVEFAFFYLSIFIYPIILYKIGYIEDDYIYVGNKNELKSFLSTYNNLKDYYEYNDNIRKIEDQKKIDEENEIQNKIDKLNYDFNENFI
jgi:hypothetical protein